MNREPVLQDIGITDVKGIIALIQNQGVWDGSKNELKKIPEEWKRMGKIFLRGFYETTIGCKERHYIWWSGSIWRRGAQLS